MSSDDDAPNERPDAARPTPGPDGGGPDGGGSAVPPWSPSDGPAGPAVPGPRGGDPGHGWSTPTGPATPGTGWSAPSGPADPGVGSVYGAPHPGSSADPYGARPGGGAAGYPSGPSTGGWAPRPGIVPLRPLVLGEILDGAIGYIRAHPRVVLGAAALVAVATQLVALLLDLVLGSMTVLSAADAGLPPGAMPDVTAADYASGLITQLATVVLSGLLIVVISRCVLGAAVDAGETWAAARPRVPGLLGITVITVLAAAAVVIVATLPGLLILGAGGGSPGILAVGGILLILGLIAGILVAVAIVTALSLAAPVFVLEGGGVVDALRRSWQLVRPRFWPVLGTQVLAGIIGAVISAIVTVPFALAAMAMSSGPAVAAPAGFGATVVTSIGTIIAITLTAPFQAGVTGLLYVDQRMRREGFDIELQRAAAFGT